MENWENWDQTPSYLTLLSYQNPLSGQRRSSYGGIEPLKPLVPPELLNLYQSRLDISQPDFLLSFFEMIHYKMNYNEF